MYSIILSTKSFGDRFFNSDNSAPYNGFKHAQLKNWDDVNKVKPIPAIGLYKGKYSEICFTFLKVTEMSYDETDSPVFQFRFISSSIILSSRLNNILPIENQSLLFSSINTDILIEKLKQLKVDIPNEWLEIAKTKIISVKESSTVYEVDKSKDYFRHIGDYYKELLNPNFDNSEKFEDLTADLLTALDFEVYRKGHNIRGTFADGVAVFSNTALVYDCKDQNDFLLKEDFKRAMTDYIKDEKMSRDEKEFFPVFIARGFKNTNIHGFHFFKIESLIYLLYKKLTLGKKFSLKPLLIILTKNYQLTKEEIDKYWN